jgi:hypothetical protein
MHDHRGDGIHQRQGIDRSVILNNSKQILIDEKVRGRNKITGKVYQDIALEEWSDREKKIQGWVVKPLLCDYIAYAIAPLGICYLMPVIQMQMAWKQNEINWKKNYFSIIAKNEGYETLSWCIPVNTLFMAIGSCLRINFSPLEINE